MNLEQTLIDLEPVGKPRVSKMRDGWYASIDIPAPAGCKAEVASNFNHKTPSEAVAVMIERLDKLRNKFNASNPTDSRLLQGS